MVTMGKGPAMIAGLKLCATLWLAGLSAAAFAGAPVTVRIVDAAGRPVTDAVVTLVPASGGAPRPRAAGGYRVVQKNTTFNPFVSIVPVGATVAFPNLDPFRHHVYSFSPAKTFELKLFASDQSRSVTFDRAGIVAIGCNIHDSMSAYIFVSDTPWAQRTPASGTVRFSDSPSGAVVMKVWHPYLRSPGGVLVRPLGPVDAARSETLKVSLRAPPVHTMSDY